MTQPWVPPTGNTWVDVTLKKRIGNPGGALTFPEGDQNKSDAENALNWLGNRMMELLNSQWQTGDIKVSFTNTVPDGWLLVNNTTIGNDLSGSTYIGDDYFNLYSVVWAFAQNDDLLTSGGAATTKGLTALADWGANKRLYLPDIPSRTLVGAGNSRSSLTNRTIGSKFGAESVSYTPQGSVSQASVSGITATCGPISTSSITGSVSQATATCGSVDINSLTATCDSISIASLTATCGPISTASLTSTVTVNNSSLRAITSTYTIPGTSCSTALGGLEKNFLDCTTLEISLDDISDNLESQVSATATIGGSIPSPNITMGGSIPSPSITIGGAIPSPSITVGSQTVTIGGSIASPSITIGGSIATQTFTGTSASISIVQPSIATYFLIKI